MNSIRTAAANHSVRALRHGRFRGPRRLIVTFYLWFLLAMTLTVAAVTGLFALWSERSWEERLENVVLNQVRVARDFTQTLLGRGVDWSEIEASLAPMLRDEGLSLIIARPDGTPVHLIAPPAADASTVGTIPGRAVSAIQATGRWIDFGHGQRISAGLPIQLGDSERGLFYVSGGRERWGPHGHGGRFPIGLVAILGLAWLLCWPLASHLSRPLRRLAEAADALGKGDLNARVDLQRRDEVGVLARSFNTMAANIQRLIASHKQLLADVSHELRSPLARLQVALELARQDAGPASRTFLENAQRQSDALDGLIGELLAHSRLDAGPVTLQKGPVECQSWLEAQVSGHVALAEKRRIRLELAARPELPALSADRRLLERALGNVLRNAIAFSPEGGTVSLSADSDGPSIQISVRDQGPGAAAELLEQIFEPFYRADAGRARSAGGVGLGLAIARRAVEAHGGKIWAENASGGGLIVRMRLPAGGT